MLFAGSVRCGARWQDHSWLPVRSAGVLGPAHRHEAGQEGSQHEAQPAGGVRTQCGRVQHSCGQQRTYHGRL